MKGRSKAGALFVAVALAFSLVSARPAAAADAGKITLYVVGGLAAFVTLVFVGTWLTRDESKVFRVGLQDEDAEREGVQYGLACRGPDGLPALVCW